MTQRDAGLLMQVREYINANLHREIPVSSICKGFNINKTKLQECFREYYGVSIHACLLQQRMERAKVLLMETEDPVKYVALQCGYKKVRSFNKAFKNKWKISPDPYRKNCRPVKSNTNAVKSYTC
jgi:AraC-like DNA-binding protein